jgi:hypothetical protein
VDDARPVPPRGSNAPRNPGVWLPVPKVFPQNPGFLFCKKVLAKLSA